MSSRSIIYDILSATLLLGSLFFFYQATVFLVSSNYISAALTVFIGLVVIRVGVELGRFALLIRRREREAAPPRSS